MAATTNLLQYLQSKTQIDFDNLDIDASKRLGPFVDCTSNQMDAYQELLNPTRAALLKKSASLAKEIHTDYPAVTLEELAYEIAMISLAHTIFSNITGAILVMANPLYAYSTQRTVENGQRLYSLCERLQPGFDLSRMIVKVASTWEGLQACRKLKALGVRTLATTAFSLEQCVLAAEVGCVYVSPFLNELKATVDPSYHDPSPNFGVIVDAQRYYEQHSYPIKVKACAAVSVDQILRLAGVAAFTATADQLQELSNMTGPAPQSVFWRGNAPDGHMNGGKENNGNANSDANRDTNGPVANGDESKAMMKVTFVDDESGFRLAFAKVDDGKAQLKTTQSLHMFSEYQIKAEAMMRDAEMTNIR